MKKGSFLSITINTTNNLKIKFTSKLNHKKLQWKRKKWRVKKNKKQRKKKKKKKVVKNKEKRRKLKKKNHDFDILSNIIKHLVYEFTSSLLALIFFN